MSVAVTLLSAAAPPQVVVVERGRDTWDYVVDVAQITGALLAAVALGFAIVGIRKARSAENLAQRTAAASESLAQTAGKQLEMLEASWKADLQVQRFVPHEDANSESGWRAEVHMRNHGRGVAWNIEVWLKDEANPERVRHSETYPGRLESGQELGTAVDLPSPPSRVPTIRIYLVWTDASDIVTERDTGYLV